MSEERLPEKIAARLFARAIQLGQASDVWHCLVEGGSATVDPKGDIIMVTSDDLDSMARQMVTVEDVQPVKPECKGFHWMGQTFDHCDMCGGDITEHEGLAWRDAGGNPFDRDPANERILPFDEARQRIPLFAMYVTPIGVDKATYEGPYRYNEPAEFWK